MRKYVRGMLKEKARKEGVKASAYVHDEFDDIQTKRYGNIARKKNIAKGTEPRSKWRSRIEAVLED
jgi:hypothetical protein